jgi:hypothetical protein
MDGWMDGMGGWTDGRRMMPRPACRPVRARLDDLPHGPTTTIINQHRHKTQRHVPLKHEAEEAERKAAAAKRGLRAVLEELQGMHEGQGLEDSDWEEEEAVCVVCGGGEATDENDIAVCDRCLCPFHQECCHPVVSARELGEEDEEWWCRRCELLYDSFSNAVLDACGVDEAKRRTFKKVQALLETDGEGDGSGSDEEEGRGKGKAKATGKGKPTGKKGAAASAAAAAAAAAAAEEDSGMCGELGECVFVCCLVLGMVNRLRVIQSINRFTTSPASLPPPTTHHPPNSCNHRGGRLGLRRERHGGRR